MDNVGFAMYAEKRHQSKDIDESDFSVDRGSDDSIDCMKEKGCGCYEELTRRAGQGRRDGNDRFLLKARLPHPGTEPPR
jgi:hypothetical protein